MRVYTRTQLLLGCEHGLPEHSERALSRFVEANPHWNGAAWADALDVLDDSDSCLNVTEPMWDALNERVTDNKRLIGLVSITLAWAWRPGPSPLDVEPDEVLDGIARVEQYLAAS